MPVELFNNVAPGEAGLGLAAALGECLACGLVLFDGDGKVLKLTPEAARILRLASPTEGASAAGALPEAVRGLAREAVAGGTPVVARQISLPNGSDEMILSVTAVPLRDPRDGASLVLVLNDLTSVRRLEQSLWRLDRLAAMGMLAAGMSHEIRNALVAGKALIELLIEQHPGLELAEVARREMARIDTMVNRMLRFSAPAEATFAPLSLHEVLDHSLHLVRTRIKGGTVSIQREFHAAQDRVLGGEYELQQAFLNLLLNALDAMESGGTLVVATELHPGPGPASSIRVTVQDTGVGIPPDQVNRLFEPFFTTKPGGTGLGLAITRRIIEQHRGTINAHSEPQQGSTFTILLPLLPQANAELA
jgi:signal transduction histidine kinase